MAKIKVETPSSSAPKATEKAPAKVAAQVDGAASRKAAASPKTRVAVDAPATQAGAPKASAQQVTASKAKAPKATVATETSNGSQSAASQPAAQPKARRAVSVDPAPQPKPSASAAPTAKVAKAPKAQVKARAVVEAPAADPTQGAWNDYDQTERAYEANGQGPDPASASNQASSARGIGGARRSVQQWVRQTFPGHENAFWGGVLALLIALLVFAFGLWRVLFIGLLVAVGVAVGQILDGDAKIINTIRDLILRDREEQ